MARTMTAAEIEILRANVDAKTDRQIGEILGMQAREVLRERLRLGMRKSWQAAWDAGKAKVERDAERRDRFRRLSHAGRSRQKVVVVIRDVQETGRSEVLEVTLDDGRKVRVRRDLVEFFAGRIALPAWLWERINQKKEG